MTRGFGIALLVLMILAGACGGGGDDSSNKEPAESEAENELAASLLLTVDDFPTGWAEDTSADEENAALEKECDTGPAPGRTGWAETGDFSKGGSSSISQQFAVFQSTDAAQDALHRIESRGKCAVDVINDGKLDDSEFEFSDASFSRASFPAYGDASEAYRLEAHVKAKGETGLGSEGSFYIDLIAVVKGRFGFSIQAVDVFSPFESDILESTVETAAKKIPSEAEPKTPSAVATPTRAPTVAPTPTAAPFGESRENPVPLGEPGTAVEKVQAKVIAVNLDAWPAVQAENQFNDPPEPGKRMVMVTLDVTNVGPDSLDFVEPTYGLVGDKAVVYETFDPSCGVIPDELTGELFPGGTKQGNVCFQADTDDANLVLFVEMYTADFEQERLFLALQ